MKTMAVAVIAFAVGILTFTAIFRIAIKIIHYKCTIKAYKTYITDKNIPQPTKEQLDAFIRWALQDELFKITEKKR